MGTTLVDTWSGEYRSWNLTTGEVRRAQIEEVRAWEESDDEEAPPGLNDGWEEAQRGSHGGQSGDGQENNEGKGKEDRQDGLRDTEKAVGTGAEDRIRGLEENKDLFERNRRIEEVTCDENTSGKAGGNMKKKKTINDRNGVEGGVCEFTIRRQRRKISTAVRRLVSREVNGVHQLVGELRRSIAEMRESVGQGGDRGISTCLWEKVSMSRRNEGDYSS